MTDQQLIKDYLRTKEVTKCLPVLAKGAETNNAVRKDINAQRRRWREDNQ